MSSLLNRKQVADRLGISQRTVIRLQDDGSLPYVKIRGQVRYDPAAVEALCRPAGKTGASHEGSSVPA